MASVRKVDAVWARLIAELLEALLRLYPRLLTSDQRRQLPLIKMGWHDDDQAIDRIDFQAYVFRSS